MRYPSTRPIRSQGRLAEDELVAVDQIYVAAAPSENQGASQASDTGAEHGDRVTTFAGPCDGHGHDDTGHVPPRPVPERRPIHYGELDPNDWVISALVPVQLRSLV